MRGRGAWRGLDSLVAIEARVRRLASRRGEMKGLDEGESVPGRARRREGGVGSLHWRA